MSLAKAEQETILKLAEYRPEFPLPSSAELRRRAVIFKAPVDNSIVKGHEIIRLFIMTPMKRDVLHYVALGLENEIMAEIFGTSVNSVKDCKKRMYEQLEVNSNVGLLVRSAELGFLDPRKYVTEEQSEAALALGPRTGEVLDALIEDSGRTSSNKEIGDKLNISTNTVDYHLDRSMNAFNVSSREKCALIWYSGKVDSAKSEDAATSSSTDQKDN